MTQLATDVDVTLNNGRKMPALGLGTVPPANVDEVKDQVITAVKAGYRHIDTAWYYGSEPAIGAALKELFAQGYKREDVFVTTKVWPSYWHNPEQSIDESLQSLGLDYVDLVLQHWPLEFESGPDGIPAVPKDADGHIQFADDPATGTKFIAVYQELEKILEKGEKTRSIGVSNYAQPKLEQLLAQAKVVPVTNQIEYHCQLPQQDLVDFCESKGIKITAYSPVGSAGAPVLKVPLVQELADKYQVTTNEVCNAYHILQGRISIPRSSNLNRIKNNVRLPQLTEDELARLYKVGEENPKRYICDEWGPELGFKWWNVKK
ncbi:D-arabinose dehydrogenase [NAD(P)+] heavy chain [Diutina catenulata]